MMPRGSLFLTGYNLKNNKHNFNQYRLLWNLFVVPYNFLNEENLYWGIANLSCTQRSFSGKNFEWVLKGLTPFAIWELLRFFEPFSLHIGRCKIKEKIIKERESKEWNKQTNKQTNHLWQRGHRPLLHTHSHTHAHTGTKHSHAYLQTNTHTFLL